MQTQQVRNITRHFPYSSSVWHDVADFVQPVLPETLDFGSSEWKPKVAFESFRELH